MQIEHRIDVQAPRDIMWKVTTDVENWPNWTPTIQRIRVTSADPLTTGSKVLIKQPALPETAWSITEFKEGELFTWQAILRGIETRATHRIYAGENGYVNHLVLEMKGLLAFLMWPLLRSQLKKALEQENSGFKHYCETLAHE